MNILDSHPLSLGFLQKRPEFVRHLENDGVNIQFLFLVEYPKLDTHTLNASNLGKVYTSLRMAAESRINNPHKDRCPYLCLQVKSAPDTPESDNLLTRAVLMSSLGGESCLRGWLNTAVRTTNTELLDDFLALKISKTTTCNGVESYDIIMSLMRIIWIDKIFQDLTGNQK